MDERIRVRRAPSRGQYDQETIYRIIDRDYLCHVGFMHAGQPVVIPTLYGRQADILYLHGSVASRMMKTLRTGADISASITKVDGLVLARSAFHHSMNYESVVLFGNTTEVTDPGEKLRGLKAISDQVLPGRWEEVRAPSENELKATSLLKLPIEQASAKIRTGPPVDNTEDYELDIWAGILPVEHRILPPVPDPKLRDGIEPGKSVRDVRKS